MSFMLLWIGAAAPSQLQSQEQETDAAEWTVAGGPSFVFRTVQSGSFGLNARVTRVVTRVGDVSVDLGATWQGYLSSDAWGPGGQGEDAPCPEEGCNVEPRRDGISVIGPEVAAGYRKSDAENPVFPVIGVGLYRIASDDTTGIHPGVSAGIVIPFQKTGAGPGLAIRYFRVFGERRFKSMLVFPLWWSF
jgi:hypothetical protein